MRFLFNMTMTMILVLTLSAAAADLAGTWKGSMDTPMGVLETTITFQTGEALVGTVQVADSGAKMEKAKRDGDKIYFEINLSQGKLTYEGTLAGDELKLTVTGTTGNKYPMNCKRQN